LSKEFAIAAKAFGLSKEQLFGLCKRAVEYTFLEEHEKARLRQQIFEARHALFQN
jgi:adenosine deaminase